jgi:signal transduction histidine kinase
MKLRTKIVVSFTVVIVVSFLSFGYFALASVKQDGINLLSLKMESSLSEIESLDDSPITASFSVAENADYPLLVGLYDQTKKLLSFSENEIKIDNIYLSEIKKATNNSIQAGDTSRYLLRTIDLENGSYLVLASSLQPIQDSQALLSGQIVVALSIIAFLSVMIVYLVMRKDLTAIKKLSQEADQISNGNLLFELSALEGKSEVAVLSKSLSSMAQTLQQHSGEMQKLLGDISHELKTPLTSIKGYADLLSNNLAKSDTDIRAFDILQSEIDHMTHLINDILLMSKLGAISYELSDEVSLGELVAKRFGILKELQPERDIKLVDECVTKAKVSLALITRLVDNLISNAIEHTDKTVSISVITFTEGSSWTLQYEDSGTGLPERYFADPNSEIVRFDERRSEGRGSGLGLSIIQEIVKQHSGSLTLGTSYMGGLLLRITVPQN